MFEMAEISEFLQTIPVTEDRIDQNTFWVVICKRQHNNTSKLCQEDDPVLIFGYWSFVNEVEGSYESNDWMQMNWSYGDIAQCTNDGFFQSWDYEGISTPDPLDEDIPEATWQPMPSTVHVGTAPLDDQYEGFATPESWDTDNIPVFRDCLKSIIRRTEVVATKK
jgi:hypothetical protein